VFVKGDQYPVRTPSFQVSRFSEFVFEPFAATLLYLPESARPSPQTTEYFLAQEEETGSAHAAEAVLVWSREQDEGSRDLAKRRSKGAEKEEPRFYNPKPIRFFDPIAAAEGQDDPSAGMENGTGRRSIQLSPELKAAIFAIDEELRRKKSSLKNLETKKATPEVAKPIKEEFTTLNLAGIVVAPDIQVETPIQSDSPFDPEARFDSAATDFPAESEFKQQVEDHLDAVEPVSMVPASMVPVSMDFELTVPVPTVQTELEPASIAMPAEVQVSSPLDSDVIQIPEPQPIAADSVAIKPTVSLGERLGRWIKGDASLNGNRRRSQRVMVPDMVAFYWSGGSPKPHEVVNISGSGFYLRTTEVWLPDTLVRMVLQRPVSSELEIRKTIVVLARVVRIDGDGVGHEFVTSEALQRIRTYDILPQQGTDSRQLKKFLAI
jgi:hypothetical protein